jgi:hypothetical protein
MYIVGGFWGPLQPPRNTSQKKKCRPFGISLFYTRDRRRRRDRKGQLSSVALISQGRQRAPAFNFVETDAEDRQRVKEKKKKKKHATTAAHNIKRRNANLGSTCCVWICHDHHWQRAHLVLPFFSLLENSSHHEENIKSSRCVRLRIDCQVLCTQTESSRTCLTPTSYKKIKER